MSGISISVVAGKDKSSSSIRASGELVKIMADSDRTLFGIDDDGLKKCLEKEMGRWPNDAFVRSPTPWNDLYKTYNWPEVQVHMKPISATVIEIASNPVALVSKTLANNSDTDATFELDLTDKVIDTIESNWSSTVGMSFSQKIEVNFGVAKSETSISADISTTTGKTVSKSTEISTGSKISVTLKPGHSAIGTLNASRGTLVARVQYEVTLTGCATMNYNPIHNGHHFYCSDINGVLASGGLPTKKTYSQTITAGYFGSGEVSINKIKD